jgi:PAS domain S-box-containing protein/excisionase family DNA binding protein
VGVRVVNRFYSTADVSRLCGVHISTVIRWVNAGVLPAALTPGGVRRIAPSDLARFMREHNYTLPSELEPITARSSEEKEVGRTEFLKAVVDTAGVAIFGFDPSMRMVVFNSKAEELTGYTREEARQPGFLDRLLPDAEARADAERTIVAHFRGESVEDWITVIRRKNGEELTISISTSIITDKEGGIVAICGSAHEITERMRLQRDLESSNSFLAAVIDNSPMSMQIVNDQGWTVKINHAMAEAFNISPVDIVGIGKHNFFSDQRLRRTGLVDAVKRAFEGEVVTVPFAELNNNGRYAGLDEEKIVRAVAFPISQEGVVRYVGIVFEDITEKAKLQRDLIAKNAELESFVYTVAHDLKSPIGVISSCSEMLEQTISDREDVRKQIQMIHRSTERMNEFINALLSLSRAGRWDDERDYETPTEIVVKGIFMDLRAAHPEEEIHLHMGDLPVINLHPDATEHLFQNLVFNAYKYRAPHRILEIKIHCRDSGDDLLFTVADNGIGIDISERSRIFDVFYRVPGTYTTGTGLGLAIVKRILEHAGGRVWVESEPGIGSTFYFTIPRKDE